MTKYTATFSTGQTITRNSDNAYAFAWAVIRIADGHIEGKGFSADRVNAAKAAQATLWTRPPSRHPRLRRLWPKFAKQQGFASVEAWVAHGDAEAAERNEQHQIEIVAVA